MVYLRITCGLLADYLLVVFHAFAGLNAAGKYIFTRSAQISVLEDFSFIQTNQDVDGLVLLVFSKVVVTVILGSFLRKTALLAST